MKIDEIIEKYYQKNCEKMIERVINELGYNFIGIERINNSWGTLISIRYFDFSDDKQKQLEIIEEE